MREEGAREEGDREGEGNEGEGSAGGELSDGERDCNRDRHWKKWRSIQERDREREIEYTMTFK